MSENDDDNKVDEPVAKRVKPPRLINNAITPAGIIASLLITIAAIIVAGAVVFMARIDSVALTAVISLITLAAAGLIAGWLSSGNALAEAGIGAAITSVLALAVSYAVLPLRVDGIAIFFGLVVAVAINSAAAAFGGFVGQRLRVQNETSDEIDAWDFAGTWLAQHGALPALAIITIAIAAIHWHILGGEPAGDDLSFHFAESARISDCLRHFDLDLWNPSANAGYASGYYYQILPQLASAIPAAIFGHHPFFFSLSVIFPLVLAPAACYRGMRLLGASPWQSVVAAFVIAFMNGESRWGAGNAGTFQVGLYTQTWALAIFPLALGHGARWMRDGLGLASAIAWGGAAFLCHPFAGISLGVAFVIGFLCKFIASWRVWLSPTMGGVLLLYLAGGPFLAFAALKVVHVGPEIPTLAILASAGGVAIGAALVIMFRTSDAYWRHPSVVQVSHELHRLAILGIALMLTTAPVLLPLVIDREGFGGFPHRVGDEIGPGFGGLYKWWINGSILDFTPKELGRRLPLLTFGLIPVLAFTLWKPHPVMRWLWAPALIFATWLGLGPHAGKIGDDLLPAVRALGAMQVCIGMGIGAGTVMLGQFLWSAPWDRWLSQGKEPPKGVSSTVYGIRTGIAAVAASLVVFVAYPGSRALLARIHTLRDYNVRPEMMQVGELLGKLPQGRHQPGPGAENHWWNLTPYIYERVPTTLQMGGGGLQASPNYDALWTVRDYTKNAWIYDAPYLTFERSKGASLPDGDIVARTDKYEIRRLHAPGLVSPVQVVGVLPPWYRTGELGHMFALIWLKSDMPLANMVEAYVGSGTAGPPPQGKTLRAWRQDSPGDDADIVAEVEATAPTTFWVHESWHPRWHAFVDGNEVAVRRVTPDFPAVDVPAGKHTIELRFQRPLWLILSWLLWPGAALGAWLVLRTLARRDEANRLAPARVVD